MKKAYLGISDTHDAGAALVVDGVVVAAVSEDRFTRKKNQCGYPINSIKYCLSKLDRSNVKIEVAIATEKPPLELIYQCREASYSVSDYWKEYDNYWKPKLSNEAFSLSYYEAVSSKFGCRDTYYDYSNLRDSSYKPLIEKFNKQRIERISADFEIDASSIYIANHEECHVYYSLFARKRPIDHNTIIITCEGHGDFSNLSVWRFNSTDLEPKLVSSTSLSSIAQIYRYTTLLLGLLPNQHEYKVMGMAPYASANRVKELKNKVFDRLHKFDYNLLFEKNAEIKDLIDHFYKGFREFRFDDIAGAVQAYLEEHLLRVCKNILSQNKDVNSIVFTGGVAQNIKAMGYLQNQLCIPVIVNPSSGDTCLPIGAAIHSSKKENKSSLHFEFSPFIGPSPSYSTITCSDSVSYLDIFKNYASEHNLNLIDLNYDTAAQLIFSGKILATCSSSVEFGQRALGNRSIICNPSDPLNIERINSSVKIRDFWMPFTPSILSDYRDDYIKGHMGYNNWMTCAYETTDLAKKHLSAAIHPRDFTARPHIVFKEDQPRYYNLISAFHKISGIPALLNTSFNKHGDVIVTSYKTAFDTFVDSGIYGLVLDNHIVLKDD